LNLLLASSVWQSAGDHFFDIDVVDQLNLLQLKAQKNNRTAYRPGRCHGFGNQFFDARRGITADYQPDLLDNRQTAPSELEYCRCFGDTHCTAVPFDLERVSNRETVTAGGHYQYDGPGVSRFAKAADGSWEIQIFQCGVPPNRNFHPSGEVGVAIKVDGLVVEVGTQGPGASNVIKCLVNGELKPAGYELHLPTGFHFQCPKAIGPVRGYGNRPQAFLGTFCASKEGQFVSEVNHWEWGNQNMHNLYVKKGVETQKENTVCYDPASRTWDEHAATLEIATTAIVAAEDVLFSQTLIDHMVQGRCQVQDPPQAAVPAGEKADPKTICDQRDPGAWQHAQDNCGPLQEQHPEFYADCLIDDCVRGDDDEEQEIEEIAEDEDEIDEVIIEAQVDGADAEGDPHITSTHGKYDLDASMLKHHRN